MALYKQGEFAQKCGIEQAYLTMYRKRGKVILTEDGMVDEANSTNALFLQKCLSRPKKEEKVKSEEPEKVQIEKPVKSKKAPKARNTEKKTEAEEKADERFDLDTAKKRIEIKKLEREAMLADMEHERKVGKLLPVDPVQSLLIHTIKNYTVAFKQASDKLLMDFANRAKMNRNEIAEMKGELIAAINRAAEQGLSESKRSVSQIIAEYSQMKKI
jgi:hypothetical protein